MHIWAFLLTIFSFPQPSPLVPIIDPMSQSRDHAQGGGADPEAAPKWVEALITAQTASLSSVISEQLSSFLSTKEPKNPAPKRPTPIIDVPSPKKSASRPRGKSEDEYVEDDDLLMRNLIHLIMHLVSILHYSYILMTKAQHSRKIN